MDLISLENGQSATNNKNNLNKDKKVKKGKKGVRNPKNKYNKEIPKNNDEAYEKGNVEVLVKKKNHHIFCCL